jgi:hypothetical protein
MSFSQYSYLQQLTSVRLVSTTNLSGTYNNGILNNGVGATLIANSVSALTIDSVAVNQGDRILLAGQSSANQNGVYVATSAGSSSSIWILTRSEDQQNIEQLKVGQYLSVGAGTTKAGAMYVLVEPLPAHLGVDSLTFSPSSDPSGGTFLLAANNLSDVASVSTARTNLGAQSAASIKVGQFSNPGGSATVNITAPGVVASNIGFVSIETSANAVTVQKADTGTGVIVALCSGDPGVSVFNYLVFATTQ